MVYKGEVEVVEANPAPEIKPFYIPFDLFGVDCQRRNQDFEINFSNREASSSKYFGKKP